MLKYLYLTEIPVFPTITARVTFQDFKSCSNIPSSMFFIPRDYKVSLYSVKTSRHSFQGEVFKLITGRPYKRCDCLYVRNIKKCIGVSKGSYHSKILRIATCPLCGTKWRILAICVDCVITRYNVDVDLRLF